MKLLVFGLSISSSWGNGHATLWRGLAAALTRRGHQLVFFERDVPYFATHRDYTGRPGTTLALYPEWAEALPLARRHLAQADAALVTSYCPDAIAATELVLSSRVPVKAFYDLDAPITLQRLRDGENPEYLGEGGLAGFDLVLSFSGGVTLPMLQTLAGAKKVVPLYGFADPAAHFPAAPVPHYRGDLSYLATYAANRQQALEKLFLAPAERLPSLRFMLGGSMYPGDFPWKQNLHYVHHVPPPDHPAFYCSSRLTLNVTRGPMARLGHCPSGRLFEAAACGVPVLTDPFEGLESFFRPGEILVARSTEDVVSALQLSDSTLRRIGEAARARVLADHSADARAEQLLSALSLSSWREPPQREPAQGRAT